MSKDLLHGYSWVNGKKWDFVGCYKSGVILFLYENHAKTALRVKIENLWSMV